MCVLFFTNHATDIISWTHSNILKIYGYYYKKLIYFTELFKLSHDYDIIKYYLIGLIYNIHI